MERGNKSLQSAEPLTREQLQNPGIAADAERKDLVRSGETVTVACALPNGLRLTVYEEFDDVEPVPGGTRPVKRFMPRDEEFTLKGTALSVESLRNQILPEYRVENGYALTTGIPKDFWELWCKQHHDLPAIRNGLVFSEDTEDRARSKAREVAGRRTGLEPIDPEHPEKTVPMSPGFKITRSDARQDA